MLLARAQIKNERYREAVKTLNDLILEHNHKYIQTTKVHIDYYNDYKFLAIAYYNLDDIKKSIENFEQATDIGSRIFVGINENSKSKDSDSILGSLDKDRYKLSRLYLK